MTDRYLRSTDGSNSDNGSTWALAKATLSGIAAIPDAAGDIIYVSQVHAESTAGAQVITLHGSVTTPSKVICSNDAAEPPTAVATSATITTTGTGAITLSGCHYCYGITFSAGTLTTASNINLEGTATNQLQRYERCAFKLPNTNGTSAITTSVQATWSWRNCDVQFGAAAQAIVFGGRFDWDGGSVLAGGTSPTNIVRLSSSANFGLRAWLRNLDLSNCSAGVNVFATNTTPAICTIANSKLPSSWSGVLVSGTLQAGQRFSMYNCDASGTNYKLWVEDYSGTIKDETTLIRTGGASDGTTGLSWKMVTNGSASYPTKPLVSDEIVVWNDTTGASKTVTVEILRDSATNLTDGEIWLDASYLGSSGDPQGTFIRDAKADVLATAADQSSSAVTWTTTGMSNPNKQKLSVTFTPQLKGPIYCRVVLAKASATVYVDPVATVS